MVPWLGNKRHPHLTTKIRCKYIQEEVQVWQYVFCHINHMGNRCQLQGLGEMETHLGWSIKKICTKDDGFEVDLKIYVHLDGTEMKGKGRVWAVSSNEKEVGWVGNLRSDSKRPWMRGRHIWYLSYTLGVWVWKRSCPCCCFILWKKLDIGVLSIVKREESDYAESFKII